MEVSVSRGEVTVVSTKGEIDLSNVGELRAVLEDVLKGQPDGFVIDLTGSRYIDSSGLTAIISSYRSLHARGGKLALVATDQYLKRILHITSLHMLPDLFICDDVDSATKRLRG